MVLRSFLCVLLASFATASAWTLDNPGESADGPPAAEVVLVDRGEDGATLTIRFATPVTRVVLGHGTQAYRADGWTSRTEGAGIFVQGDIDVLACERPCAEVAFDIAPRTEPLQKAYTPYLAFSDGGRGVLTGQFEMHAATGAALEGFTGTADDWPGDALTVSVRIVAERPIVAGGQRYDGSLTLRPEGAGQYVYLGGARALQAENFTGIVDPGMPDWVADALDDELGRMIDRLDEKWGMSLPSPPDLLFVYGGPDGPGITMTGGAVGMQLALEISGEDVANPEAMTPSFLRRFLFHELIHLYQQAAGLDDIDPDHAWLHEGHTETMAQALAAATAEDGPAFLRVIYGNAIRGCAEYLSTGASLVQATERRAFRAHYDCGDFIGLMLAAGLPEGADLYQFWRRLLAENVDMPLGPERYFATAAAFDVPAAVQDDIRRILFDGVEDPGDWLPERLRAAGYELVIEDGELRRFAFP